MKHSFAPLADEACTTLILGSLPGEESLRQVQYYAHPRNAFWRILCDIFEEDFTEEYTARCTLALRHGIALWDVIGAAEREGSLDTAIRNPKVNDFATFLQAHPSINKICLNGGKAEQLFKRHCLGKNGMLNANIYRTLCAKQADNAHNTPNTQHPHNTQANSDIKIIALPSTSPANAKMCYAQKLSIWRDAILGE